MSHERKDWQIEIDMVCIQETCLGISVTVVCDIEMEKRFVCAVSEQWYIERTVWACQSDQDFTNYKCHLHPCKVILWKSNNILVATCHNK